MCALTRDCRLPRLGKLIKPQCGAWHHGFPHRRKSTAAVALRTSPGRPFHLNQSRIFPGCILSFWLPRQFGYITILTSHTMADDSRQPDEQAAPRLRAPANIMPGGTAHTAGGEKPDTSPNYIDAVRSLGPEYYLNFHKRPCVRDSQLQGLAAGFAGGSLAAILGSKSGRTVWG
jgi:hypothetical protein